MKKLAYCIRELRKWLSRKLRKSTYNKLVVSISSLMHCFPAIAGSIRVKNVYYKPPPLTLKGSGYFTNEKDGGGGLFGPPVYLGSKLWKEAAFFRVLIFCKQKYFAKEPKRFGHNCLN